MTLYSTLYTWYSSLRRARRLSRIRRENMGRERLTKSLACGYRIKLRLNDHVAQRILLSGRFEPEAAAAMVGVVRPGMIVADIGANIGIHTLQLAQIVGPDVGSPKAALRFAARHGWIDDEAAWLELLKARNLTVHTYHQDTATAVYSKLPYFNQMFRTLLEKMVQAGN